jgi:hypothetical protein
MRKYGNSLFALMFTPLLSLAGNQTDELRELVTIGGLQRFQSCVSQSENNAEGKALALLYGVIASHNSSDLSGHEQDKNGTEEIRIEQHARVLLNQVDVKSRVVNVLGTSYLCVHAMR